MKVYNKTRIFVNFFFNVYSISHKSNITPLSSGRGYLVPIQKRVLLNGRGDPAPTSDL